MDLRQLKLNWRKSANLCISFKERWKFMAWIYDRPRFVFNNRCITLHLLLEEPIGTLDVLVRFNQGADAFIFSEVFEHRFYSFELPQVPRTLLDLGANIGLTALFFAKRYPDAILACVEPMEENLILLKANLELNSVSAHVVSKAIAVEDGTVPMQRAELDYGHKINPRGFEKETAVDTIETPAISVSSLMGELGWERIGLLKVDIEGYEAMLLRANCEWLLKVDALCIECHDGFSLDDLGEVAKIYGFCAPIVLPGLFLLLRNA
jgi:FkbM family methyltransferase